MTTYRAKLELLSYGVTFETECLSAYIYFRDHQTYFPDYSFDEQLNEWPALTVQYIDSPEYAMTYEPECDRLTLQAPWASTPRSTLLEMAVILMCELDRQRKGEYILHASAVSKDGVAIVLPGASESGKTTVALDLCYKHGFELMANDKVVVSLVDGVPTVLRGDPSFNFRYKSLSCYSQELCDRVFGQPNQDGRTWDRKRRVDPQDLGIIIRKEATPISAVAFVKLDASIANALEEAGTVKESLFFSKVALYSELSELIRGNITPFNSRHEFCEIYVPNLDTFEFVKRRVTFLSQLLKTCRISTVRGPLSGVSDIVRQALGNATPTA